MFCFVRQYCFSIAFFFFTGSPRFQSEAVTVSFSVAVDFRKIDLLFPAVSEHLGCCHCQQSASSPCQLPRPRALGSDRLRLQWPNRPHPASHTAALHQVCKPLQFISAFCIRERDELQEAVPVLHLLLLWDFSSCTSSSSQS